MPDCHVCWSYTVGQSSGFQADESCRPVILYTGSQNETDSDAAHNQMQIVPLGVLQKLLQKLKTSAQNAPTAWQVIASHNNLFVLVHDPPCRC